MRLSGICTCLFAAGGFGCLCVADSWLRRPIDAFSTPLTLTDLGVYAFPSLLVVLFAWLTRQTPGPALIVTLAASLLAGWSAWVLRTIVADDEIGFIRLWFTAIAQVFALVVVLPVPLVFCLRRRFEDGENAGFRTRSMP